MRLYSKNVKFFKYSLIKTRITFQKGWRHINWNMDQKEVLNLSVLKSGFQKSSWLQIIKVIAHLQVCCFAPLCLHFFQQMSHGLDSAIILVGSVAMSKSPPTFMQLPLITWLRKISPCQSLCFNSFLESVHKLSRISLNCK